MAGESELTVISLGGGVQSSVLTLMAAEGLIKPMPDFAVFADTGWEPKEVYNHIDWLAEQIPFPIRRVSNSNIRENILAGTNSTGQPFTSIPAFIRSPNGKTSIVKRQCTREYKLKPIEEDLRDMLGVGYKERVPQDVFVELWIGISKDEAIRMKPSRLTWINNYWPLIEMGYSRSDCKQWFEERYPDRMLPRSACIGCPYHTDSEWSRMKSFDPESWQDAVYIDSVLRSKPRRVLKNGEMYLHRSRVPLSEVEFRQYKPMQMSLFNDEFGNECEGLCGV